MEEFHNYINDIKFRVEMKNQYDNINENGKGYENQLELGMNISENLEFNL